MTPEDFNNIKKSSPKGRKSIYPFSKMNVGEVVRVNTNEVQRDHTQIISAAHAYANGKNMRFETTRDGDDVLVHRAE